MTGTGLAKQGAWLHWLWSILLIPALALAADDHIRLDNYQSTVNIDWQGHVTGNDPISVYISRNNGGTFCTRVSSAAVLVERPPLTCSGEFNATNSCYGGGLHEPIALAGIWSQAHVPISLCNVNEQDVYLNSSGNNKTPQPAHFYPFPSVDSNPDIPANLVHYPMSSVQGDGKTLLDPIAFCNQMGRPGSYTHDYVVRMLWDPAWGGTGFFTGIVNFINEVPTETGFDFSWINTNNNGTADTQYTGTINCLAPPTPTINFSLQPTSVNATVDANYNVVVTPTPMLGIDYHDPACLKTMQGAAFFAKQTLTAPGSAPDHAATVVEGSPQPQQNQSPSTGCTSQTWLTTQPVVTSQAAVLCKDSANSGKTLVRSQTLTAQLCSTGTCTTLGSADLSADKALTVNVVCPKIIPNPTSTKTPVGLGQPASVGAAAASVQSPSSTPTPPPAAATQTLSVPSQTAPKPADEIDIPAAKPKP